MNYIFCKGLGAKQVTIKLDLEAGETPFTADVGPTTPSSSDLKSVFPGFTADGLLLLNLESTVVGDAGFHVTVTTDRRSLAFLVGVSTMADDFDPYRGVDPSSFNDLVGSLAAGESALATVVFPFPVDAELDSGFVTWELLGQDGVVYSSGSAISFVVEDTGISLNATAKAIISVPSDILPTTDAPYTLRYTLDAGAERFFSYEQIYVTGLTEVPEGPQDIVELVDRTATLQIVVDRMYAMQCSVYYEDNLVHEVQVANARKVAGGYLYETLLHTGLPVSLEPYAVVWSYGPPDNPRAFTETSRMWVFNSSMLMAMNDVQQKVNKARQTLYGTPNSLYHPADIAVWMRRARDAFNVSFGVFVSFTFTRPTGPLREYWMLYTELAALDSQYLFEGEQAFQFQGANISLDVDRTQYLDSAASKIQQRLDNEFKPIKQNMVIRGCTAGNGSEDPRRLRPGALGAVGLSINATNVAPGGLPYLRR